MNAFIDGGSRMELTGKTALITGGGRGIGKSVAEALAREKCKIAICSRNRYEVESVVSGLNNAECDAIGLPMDISVEENIEDLVKKTIDRFGTIDILFNAAGYAKKVPFLDETMEEFEKNLTINLKAVFTLSQKVLKIMIKKQSGYIINVSSTVVLGVPDFLTSYGASKCGLTGISQAMYEFAKKFNVKVSSIYPDYTDTKMLRDIDPPVDPSMWLKPDDIAYCVLFLLKSSDRMVIRDLIPRAFLADR